MRLLFVGETWLGSSARSLKEAFLRRGDVELTEVRTDQYVPIPVSRPARAINRLLWPLQQRGLERAVRRAAARVRPDVVMMYKGWHFSRTFIASLQGAGHRVVNVYPDCSPFAHGKRLAEALGFYDLVISTKPFHPRLWNAEFGYSNPCTFVAHGYDPAVHLRSDYPEPFELDVTLVASGRPEYRALVLALAERLGGEGLKVEIAGPGWDEIADVLPSGWRTVGPQHGDAYLAQVKRAKIVVAPVQRTLTVNGQVHPGDEDSTRTYELAAAHAFMIHQYTDFMPSVFDAETEVPLYDGADDLAEKLLFYLEWGDQRRAMAAAAHARAVPAYSIDQRASDILDIIRTLTMSS